MKNIIYIIILLGILVGIISLHHRQDIKEYNYNANGITCILGVRG